MDQLAGVEVVNKHGRRFLAKDILKDKKGVGFYFSAHWCPPCRQFTPRLAQAYADSRQGPGGSVEIIFVSSDRTEAEFYSYMKEAHGDWYGIVPGQPAGQLLSHHFSVRGIPALKVVALDGSLIAEDGRGDVMSLGRNAFSQWEQLAPSPVDISVVDLLLDNEHTVKTEACDILIRLLSNIIKDPNNIKYRQVKLTNPKIEEKLLPAAGAFEVLFSVGFEEADDKLVLPLSASIAKVEKFKEAIEGILKGGSGVGAASKPSSGGQGPSPGASGGQGTSSGASGGQEQSPGASGGQGSLSGVSGGSSSVQPSSSHSGTAVQLPDVLTREVEFHQRLQASLRHMKTYEDPEAQAAALSVMPVERFETEARVKFERAQASDSSLPPELYRDLLLLEFKEWFKTDFFKWVDAPKCDSCGGDTTSKGMLVPTQQEQWDGAGRVEGYACKGCSLEVRFPRYHAKPAKLLETRRGRCGEWANCFVLCCRALGFDTRHVLDWTDHVWSEVWSDTEKRWLHVDPGEAVDKPLVYEAGWGKKLTYVIASSKDEVQDVTWRYSKDHTETKQRRNLVRPRWLVKTILQLTANVQEGYTVERREELNRRRLADCLEMLTPRKVGEGETVGRKTGSLAWRIARGEMGSVAPSTEFTFIPSPKDLENGVFSLQYYCAADKYLLGDGTELSGWRSCVLESSNVSRVVETDWNKVYLSRQEGNTAKGTVTWKVKLPEGYVAGRVQLLVNSTVFKTGRVVWQLCGESSCLLPQPATQIDTEQLNGSVEVKLTASMSQGEGDLAWQHTQLFRCDRDAVAEPNMKLSIALRKL